MVGVWPRDVPRDASCMFYATNVHRGNIFWWENNGRWCWVAAGNNGEEATEREAVNRAKRWIRDGE